MSAESQARSLDVPTYMLKDIAVPKQEDDFHMQSLGLADRPFANLVKTTPVPQRYQAVLDVSTQASSVKAKRLRSILRDDALHHFFIVSELKSQWCLPDADMFCEPSYALCLATLP